MCMVPMDLHKRRKEEEAGLLWLGLAARRARLGQAGRVGEGTAGVSRVPSRGRVVDTLSSTTYEE
jgi:hypothetical protein